MYTLFIDTHDFIITVALINEEKIVEKTQESEYSHAVFLAPMIRDILLENKITVKEIKSIVAVNGPGSFTGLRIGLSAAKTLSYLLNIPIYLISSLTSYLVSYESVNDKVCILQDNKGYYVSVFDKNNNSKMEECYVQEILDYKLMEIVPLKLDVKKVVLYALKQQETPAHYVRANYVKKIEVEK